MNNQYTLAISITYDFENPYFRNEYDEWRDDHPDTPAMRQEFVWDRFAPADIMSIVDPNAEKFTASS